MNYDNWKLMCDRDEMSYAPNELTMQEVELHLTNMGFTDINPDVCNTTHTINLGFACDGIYYYIANLCQDAYDDMTAKDLLDEADETETACCGSSYCADRRLCYHCNEHF